MPPRKALAFLSSYPKNKKPTGGGSLIRQLFHATVRHVITMAIVPASALEKPAPVSQGQDGRLLYQADARGNSLPDFSHAGYGGGGAVIPEVPARLRLAPADGDDGARIQAAIDHIAMLPPDRKGIRGAVQLEPGRFEIAGQLRIGHSGVVLRGSGSGPDGTVLVATGDRRRALIVAEGTNDRTTGEDVRFIADDLVPVGERIVHLDSVADIDLGQRIVITRPSTEAWIESLGMQLAPGRSGYRWKPGHLDLTWDRVVVAVEGKAITFDAPLTCALDKRYGGSTVHTYRWPGRISQVGIEHLRCLSEFDPERPRDEEHSWIAVAFNHLENAWVSNVSAEHFVSSAVLVGEGCKWVTVRDCRSLRPISELAGHRRQAFHTRGQLTLFQRCQSDDGRNDFAAGPLTTGPNVFLDCEARNSHGFSGSTGSWASGLLFDNVRIDGGELRLGNLGVWNQGTGWNATNSVIWQSTASRLACSSPPGAANWAVGSWGQLEGDGHWSEMSRSVRPLSLYRAQLAERLGENALANLEPKAHSALSGETPTFTQTFPEFEKHPEADAQPKAMPMVISNGWLTADERLLTGAQLETSWWRGHLLPERAAEVGPAITRFVPGRSGTGMTDDLDELTDSMLESNQIALRHHWGLWYDRRSDDHERTRRPDAEVWPPFFEQPWSRSGFPQRGEAWDRLTRYDLSRFNPWYTDRLREFTDLASDKELILINEMYFQHNLLEAGAHWAGFPWRPANNLNDTGFPEPPPYLESDGSEPSHPSMGKRIFMAKTFYDVSHPVRRDLHRAYIRQCLTNLADEANVIHSTGAEFTGPTEFIRFWLDTAAEWKSESGKLATIALSAPKDVQDAILEDPLRSELVQVIDFKYWWRTPMGLFAPPGGKNLAPRQSERLWKGGRPEDEDLARMVSEYRQRFPEKAIICGFPEAGWAFLAAGGSLPVLPKTTDENLLTAIPHMRPVDKPQKGVWLLSSPMHGVLAYLSKDTTSELDLPDTLADSTLFEIDLESGAILSTNISVATGGPITLPIPQKGRRVYWLRPNGVAADSNPEE